MRGEHASMHAWVHGMPGSSPHARGTRFVDDVLYVKSGIIPACAGNTQRYFTTVQPFRDHPRMRGEHQTNLGNQQASQGSSPHARGTLLLTCRLLLLIGIIPACAGNTDSLGGKRSYARDHPRMRGEHYDNNVSTANQQGSSPHARGTRLHDRPRCLTPGIIPACAGNTSYVVDTTDYARDHPRMRGEHRPQPVDHVARLGSSPHARGTHMPRPGICCSYGIIPACAGNTRCLVFRGGAIWDHPRMRGEHALLMT